MSGERDEAAGPWWRQRLTLVLGAALLGMILCFRIVTLGAYPLMDTTESRYAEIALEMHATDNWVTPQLDPGVPFWGKPPLSFWATALMFRCFGVSETTARFSSVLFAALTLWLVYLLALALRGRAVALGAAVVLASTGIFFVLAGGVMTDPAFSASLTLTMVAFFLAVWPGTDGRHSPLWGYFFFAGMGLAVLAKGPAGIILIAVPISLWVFLVRRRGETLRPLPWAGGTVLFLALALPWHLLAEQRTPGFLDYYIIGENFKRFLVHGWKGDLYGRPHAQPFGTVWLFFIVGALPWFGLWFGALADGGIRKRLAALVARNSGFLFLLLWMLSAPVFFTFSEHVMLPYVLPGMPAFALLTAWGLDEVPDTEPPRKRPWYARAGTWLLGALFVPVVFSLLAFLYFPRLGITKSHKAVATQFMALASDGRAKLVYLDKRPFSADFYVRGRSLDISHESPDRILQYVREHGEDYFVINRGRHAELSPEVLARLTPVKEYPGYVLYSTASGKGVVPPGEGQ